MEFDKNKIKLKIAISKIKEENDIVMENKTKNIFKTVATAIIGILLSTGVAFAGSKVVEKVWKTPEKIQLSSGDNEELTKITEESKKENITEEDAKKVAIEKLNQIGFNSNIIGTNHYKEIDSTKIMYRFDTKDNYEITIDGQTGDFFDIWNNNKNTQDTSKYITEEQAKELANKYYKLFGYKDGEYEITHVHSVNNEGIQTGAGFRMTVIYNKKYGEVYNPYESISIIVESKNMELELFRVENTPFDNNEVTIKEQEAIDIAIKEDQNVKTNKIEETKAKLMVVKMNADAYDRKNNTEEYQEMVKLLKGFLRYDDEGNERIYAPSLIAIKNGKILEFDDTRYWDNKKYDSAEEFWQSADLKPMKEKITKMINEVNEKSACTADCD